MVCLGLAVEVALGVTLRLDLCVGITAKVVHRRMSRTLGTSFLLVCS